MKTTVIASALLSFMSAVVFAGGQVAPSPAPLAGALGPYGLLVAALGYCLFRFAKHWQK